MEINLASNLFQASILLYFLAAAVSLALIKRDRVCNILSNVICIAAAVCGLAFSIVKLLVIDSTLNINVLNSAIPFISISMKVDNLSAFFLLALSILVICVSI